MLVSKSIFRVACPVVLALAIWLPAAVAQDLTLENQTLVDQSRSGRGIYDYTYTIQARNNGTDYQNVTATLTSYTPHTVVISGELQFGDIAAGDVAVSENTFTIRQNRRYPFSWDNLEWQFSYDEIQGDAFQVGAAGGTFSDSQGTLIVVPPGALTDDRILSVQTHADLATLPGPAPYLGGGRFGPSGIEFAQPVSITFSLNQEHDPGTELPVFMWEESSEGWYATDFIAMVNPDRLSATAEITHFTDFIIMGGRWLELFSRFENRFFNACDSWTYESLFADFTADTLALFPVGDMKTWDLSAHYPQYGYACYETGGITFVFNAERQVTDSVTGLWVPFDSTPTRTRTVGISGGYVSFAFLKSEDRRFGSSSCGEYQMNYAMDVTVHLAPRVPDGQLTVTDVDRCVGETAEVYAQLMCGESPVENTWVELEATKGSVFPDLLMTNQLGATPPAIYSAEEVGLADVKGWFEPFENIAGREGSRYLFDPVTVTVDACPYVKVEPPATDLFVNNGREFTATLWRADDVEMPGRSFSWSSSAGRVSLQSTSPNTVVATGVAPGPEVLTASTLLTDGETKRGSAQIEVIPLDLRVEVDPETACLTIGESVDMTATVLNESDEVQPLLIEAWTSSDENVVLIDPITGVATAMGEGRSTITVNATTLNGANLSEVLELSVSYATLEPRQFELGVHGGYQMVATAHDMDMPGTPVVTINPYIIPHEDGSPSGVVSLPYEDPNFFPYQVDPNNGLYSDPNASYKLIEYFSGNENVATVNKYGHVHGVAEGRAVISARLLPGSDVEQFACATVDVVQKPAINSQASFHGEAKNCYFGNDMQPGETPHPFSFRALCDPSNNTCSLRWGGGGNGIAILPAGTNISLIKNPAEWNIVHPPHTDFGLASGFKILLWTPETYSSFTTCGGHRYAGVQHTGFEWILRNGESVLTPVFDWYLFENYLDVPEGYYLGPTRCIDDDTCMIGSGAIATPDWDPPVTPEWWVGHWIWEEWIF